MFELTLRVAEDDVEAVCDALVEALDAASVSVEDADAGTGEEQALFGEPNMPPPRLGWRRSVVTALFDDETAAFDAARQLVEQAAAETIEVRGVTRVPEQDWVRLTQSQFAPVAITPTFWIVPTWHEPPAEARTVMRLDPGLAFGTGTHPTTRMCLRWIAEHAPLQSATWQRVLDYGCGSGILAIGAALHGATGIDAVDIDPAAVEATGANARDNGVTLRCAPPTAAQGHYDLVLANILAAPLTLLAPLLCSHLRAGADLVLAGVLERQADALKAAYAPWLRLDIGAAEDGWILLRGRRPGKDGVA